jgi:hypothetical protein
MRRLKLILVPIFLLIVSGCDVNYNLKIDKDMKIIEEIVAFEDKQYNDLAHDFLLDRISVTYYDKYSGYNNMYDFDYAEEGTMIGNKLTKKHLSIEDFKNNSAVFNDLLQNYSISTTNDIVSINASINDDIYDPNSLAHIIIPTNVNIKIDLPFKVINANADIKKGNTYIWNINKDNRSKELILSFDKNHLSNHIYILNIGISYVILLVAGIISIFSVIVLVVWKKIKSVNKI